MRLVPFYRINGKTGKLKSPVMVSQKEWDKRTALQAKALARHGRVVTYTTQGGRRKPRIEEWPIPGPVMTIASNMDYARFVAAVLDAGNALNIEPNRLRVKFETETDSFIRTYQWDGRSGLEAAGKSGGFPSSSETGGWRKAISRQLKLEGAIEYPDDLDESKEPDVLEDGILPEGLLDMLESMQSQMSVKLTSEFDE